MYSRVFTFRIAACGAGALLLASTALLTGCSNSHAGDGSNTGAPGAGDSEQEVLQNATNLVAEGRETFRHDTFGSEEFWGDTLRLHEAILGTGLGGVGEGITPVTALALGLKVDSEALGADLRAAILANQ